MRAFAECAVKKYPQLTHQMVLDIAKFRVDDQYMKAADADCLVKATAYQYGMVELRMSPAAFRYAVADVLVQRNLGSFDARDIVSAAPLPKSSLDPADYVPKRGRFKPEEYEQAKQRDLAAIALAAFGECVVRASPHGARNLLGTKINSDEELQALQSMMPSFSACLDRGSTLKTDRTTIRGTVALNYYRLAYAPRQQIKNAEAAE